MNVQLTMNPYQPSQGYRDTYEIVCSTAWGRRVYWYLAADNACEAELIWRAKHWSPAYTLQSVELYEIITDEEEAA